MIAETIRCSWDRWCSTMTQTRYLPQVLRRRTWRHCQRRPMCGDQRWWSRRRRPCFWRRGGAGQRLHGGVSVRQSRVLQPSSAGKCTTLLSRRRRHSSLRPKYGMTLLRLCSHIKCNIFIQYCIYLVYSSPGVGNIVMSRPMSVCLFVSLHISKTTLPNFTISFGVWLYVACCRNCSPLAALQCISGLVDDVILMYCRNVTASWNSK